MNAGASGDALNCPAREDWQVVGTCLPQYLFRRLRAKQEGILEYAEFRH